MSVFAHAVAFASAVAGCRVDANVGTIGDASIADASPAAPPGAPDASGRADASPDLDGSSPDAAPTDGGCGVVLAQQGTFVDLAVIDEVPPDGTGGTIVPGTYVLTSLTAYLGAPRGTAEVRQTLVVKGSPTVGTFALLSEARNTSGGFSSYPATGTSSTYEATPSTRALFVDTSCPATSSTNGTYTATATSFTSYLDAIASVYTRVP